MMVVLRPLNQMLSDPTTQAYRDAAAAVEAAASVRDAVSSIGVLDAFEPAIVAEAQAVLGAIPPAINEAIIAALSSAFERQLPVSVAWLEDPKIAVRVWEQPQADGFLVNILVLSPNGQTFV
jgi:hypothetical protein